MIIYNDRNRVWSHQILIVQLSRCLVTDTSLVPELLLKGSARPAQQLLHISSSILIISCPSLILPSPHILYSLKTITLYSYTLLYSINQCFKDHKWWRNWNISCELIALSDQQKISLFLIKCHSWTWFDLSIVFAIQGHLVWSHQDLKGKSLKVYLNN